MKLPMPAAGVMEIAMNRALQMDPQSLDQIIALQGKIIAIDISGFDLQFYLAPALDGVQILTELDDDNMPDTIIRGTPFSLLQTALSDDRSTLFRGEVQIDGDMQLGQKFQRILDGLELDWEEPLSQVVGDVAAHQFGEVARGLFSFAKSTLSSLAETSSEYFQEETRDIVNSTELTRFADKVDTLRSDADRVEMRFRKLESKLEQQLKEQLNNNSSRLQKERMEGQAP